MSIDYACGNIFIRTQEPMKKGEFVDGHEHNFDHVTEVVMGAFLIECWNGDAREVVEKRPVELPFLIKAGVKHRLTALEDNSMYRCIYSHRTPQGDVVQRYTGWEDAYC